MMSCGVLLINKAAVSPTKVVQAVMRPLDASNIRELVDGRSQRTGKIVFLQGGTMRKLLLQL